MVKIGRNDSCPCGSGRKYKRCCYLDEERNRKVLRAASRARTQEDIERILNEPPRVFTLEVRLESLRLRRFDSTISRTFEIEGTDSLYDLHMDIQSGFGWDNDHMFSFFLSDRVWDRQNEYKGNPYGEHVRSSFGDISRSAAETEIGDLSLERGSAFKYLFDFGDEIVHNVTVLDITEKDDPETVLPRMIRSIGEAPPQYGR